MCIRDRVQAWVSLSTIQSAQGQRGYPLRSLLQAIERSPDDINLRHRMVVMLLDHAHAGLLVRGLARRGGDRCDRTNLGG